MLELIALALLSIAILLMVVMAGLLYYWYKWQELMKNRCCVPNCQETQDSCMKHHRFPKHDPAIFATWIANIQCDKLKNMPYEQIYDNFRVCGKHFGNEDKVDGRNGLKRTAILLLCLPGNHDELSVAEPSGELSKQYIKLSDDDYRKNTTIVPLYDTPHLFKGIRNNLLTKDLHFKMDSKVGVAKWDHIEQFYMLDASEQKKICPKLTDHHVLRNRINKLKVKNCTQVFSYQVGALMKKLVEWKAEVNLAPEAVDTAQLILFMDK